MAKHAVQLIFVGGFLGAGKTTLLWEAARRLTDRGRRVGLITNDQAPDLVDTALLAGRGLAVREVAGSCFCCNFPGLARRRRHTGRRRAGRHPPGRAGGQLHRPLGHHPPAAEGPVPARFRPGAAVGPGRPRRLTGVLAGTTSLHPSAAYIVRKQVEEADIVVLNKMDLLAPAAAAELDRLVAANFPGLRGPPPLGPHGPGRRRVARRGPGPRPRGPAHRGRGLRHLRRGRGRAGLAERQHPPPVGRRGGRLAAVLHGRCSRTCERTFLERRADVGHVKLFLAAGQGSLVGNLTQSSGAVAVRGQIAGAPTEAQLVFNARVAISPQDLERTVRGALAEVCGTAVRAEVLHLQSLQPGRPNPTHRYKNVV